MENTRLKRSRSQSVIQALLTAENVPQDQVQGQASEAKAKATIFVLELSLRTRTALAPIPAMLHFLMAGIRSNLTEMKWFWFGHFEKLQFYF